MQHTQRTLYSALAPLLLACGALSLAGCAGAHKPAPGDHADPARSREQAMALFARAQKAHHSRD